jgi:hypothetical protein
MARWGIFRGVDGGCYVERVRKFQRLHGYRHHKDMNPTVPRTPICSDRREALRALALMVLSGQAQ